MARFAGKEDLDIARGVLSSHFRAAGLVSLHSSFIANAADTDKPTAAKALDDFYRVASKLCQTENEFNKRARPASGVPSLMNHLRGPAHFKAMREFNAAKEILLGLNLKMGGGIIRLAQGNIDHAVRTSARVQLPNFPVQGGK